MSDQDLQLEFDRIWNEIRDANLIAGQARNEVSARTVSLAQHALKLATESGNERFIVEGWRMLALTLNGNEQYKEAIPFYKKAIQKLEETQQRSLAVRMRIGYISVLANTGDYREALDVARPAEAWLEKNPDQHARARLLINTGMVYWALSDHEKAVKTYSNARRIFEMLGDKEGIAKTSLNLANILSNIDQFEEADRLYEECRELSEQIRLHELATQAGYNRAYLQFLRGRYSESLNSFGRLRERFDISGSERHSALCDLDEAEIYIQLGLSKDAAVLARRAVEKFGELGMPFEQGRAAANYGVALMQLRRFEEALDSFRDAQSIFEAAGNAYWMGLLKL